MEEWTRGKFHKGLFGGFVVYGFKYDGPHGESGWHTTSWPNANPIHDFWVVDAIFRQISIHIFDPAFGNRNSFAIGDIVEDLDPAERQAVLDAIEDWERPEQDIQSVIEQETQRLPSNASHAFEGRTNDLTIGRDGERIAVRRPENPEDRS